MRPPTLLEKLLKDEIISERNKILQCVRFVCRSNFFGVGQNIPAEGPSMEKTELIMENSEPFSKKTELLLENGEPPPPGED